MELNLFSVLHSLPGNVSCPFQAVFLNFCHINKGKIFFLLYPVIKPDNLGKVSNHYEMEEDSYSLSSHTNSFLQKENCYIVQHCSFSVIKGILSSITLDCNSDRKSLRKAPNLNRRKILAFTHPRKTDTLWTAAYKDYRK